MSEYVFSESERPCERQWVAVCAGPGVCLCAAARACAYTTSWLLHDSSYYTAL